MKSFFLFISLCFIVLVTSCDKEEKTTGSLDVTVTLVNRSFAPVDIPVSLYVGSEKMTENNTNSQGKVSFGELNPDNYSVRVRWYDTTTSELCTGYEPFQITAGEDQDIELAVECYY